MRFGLITNPSENIDNPSLKLFRAIYISIFILVLIYISVSVMAIRNFSIFPIIKAQDNDFAVAAKLLLGGTVFALNSTLYGGVKIAYSLAKDCKVLGCFKRKICLKLREDFYITAGLSMVIGLLFDIEAITSITSSVYSMIYLCMLVSHHWFADTYGGSKPLIFIFTIITFAGVFLSLRYITHVRRHSKA